MNDFETFWAAAAGVSGALVGLLFVAASVSRDSMWGSHATAENRARSALALTCFVTPVVVSLFALIPPIGIRVPILVAGISGVLFTAAAIRRIRPHVGPAHGWRQMSFLLGFGLISIVEVITGVTLQIDPDWTGGSAVAAAMLVATVGVGIDRAWELIGGRRTSVIRSLADVVRGDQNDADSTPEK